MLYVAVTKIIRESAISIYSEKLAHVQVLINCQFSVAQMRTWKDIHARLLMRTVLDDVMSQIELTTAFI